MTTFFISDLHLEESRPEITQLFFDFLKKNTAPTNALYILGDFFEIWIGDDDISPFNQTIILALQEATQKKLPIYIMHGNRDFLLGKKFLQATGCKLLPDEYVINLYDTPTLLMHGDTLCIQDIKYLQFRKKSRNWFLQKLFLLKSLKTRKKIADHYRSASIAHTSTAPDYIMDVTEEEVERVMQKHHVQHLIHGHTHRPMVHALQLNQLPATRTVLGPWHEVGSVLVCEESGSQKLTTLTTPTVDTEE